MKPFTKQALGLRIRVYKS